MASAPISPLSDPNGSTNHRSEKKKSKNLFLSAISPYKIGVLFFYVLNIEYK